MVCPNCAQDLRERVGWDGPAGGTILLVEDDDSVRTLLARVLRERGYEVIEAQDGRDALELAQWGVSRGPVPRPNGRSGGAGAS